MTQTLTEFLLARIAEDEESARAVRPGPWWIEKTSSPMDKETWAVADIERFRGYANHVRVGEDKPLAEYITRHDPARVLAECEAKRRIVGLHADGGESQGFTAKGCDGYEHACEECGAHGEYGIAWPCDTLRALAAVYADHPDYLPEWKP